MQALYNKMNISAKKPKILVILGPTASGKSELAVKLAKKFNGEIISADSRQVYRGLNIGSGKITKKEMQKIPHHLLNVANPKQTFTVSRYQKLAQKAIKNIIKRGKLPIICGGTGLYIDSIIYDLKFPEVPPQLKLRKKLEKLTTEELFKELQKLDSQRAQNIDKHNRRRLVRALEIVITIGKQIPTTIRTDSNFNALKIGVKKSPEELKKLITERLKKRLKQGMIKEIKKLRKDGLSWQRLDNFGLEYRYISRYLRGLIGKSEIVDLIQKESEKYTKRQMTWFKRDKNIIWLEDPQKSFLICRDWLDL